MVAMDVANHLLLPPIRSSRFEASCSVIHNSHPGLSPGWLLCFLDHYSVGGEGYDDLMDIHTKYELKGRSLVGSGELTKFRESLGFTRSAMAEMLHTAPATYKAWETNDNGNEMWAATAERLGRFYYSATETVRQLQADGISIQDLIPFHVAATMHGLPQELLMKWYRDGLVEAEDLGVLGLWMHKEDLHQLKEAA